MSSVGWEDEFPQAVGKGRKSADASAPLSMIAAAAAAGPAAPQRKFKLKIQFGGACAFVPSSKGRSMGVFMVGRKVTQNIDGVPPHTAIVKFRLSLVKGAGAAPPTVQGIWKLAEEDLVISLPPGKPSLTIHGFDYTRNELPVPPLSDSPDEAHFGWVASVESACAARGAAGGGKIDPAFLANVLDDQRASVLGARILLKQGTIRATNLIKQDDSFVVCRFRPYSQGSDLPNDHVQFVASRVEYELDVIGDSITLEARPLDGGGRVRSLELVPDSNGEVRLFMLNEEANEILRIVPPPPITRREARDQDRVFEVYEALCPGAAALAQNLPIPVVDDYRPALGEGGPVVKGSAPCSPEVLTS